jgi:hypothetical protein
MKRFIITAVVVLLVGVVAVGFYRGWFTVSSRNPDAGSNKVNVNLGMDPDKMQQDAKLVKEKTSELVGTATEPAPASSDSKPKAP